MRELDVLLASYGIDLTGWRLTSANAVSADGLTIAGYGTNPSGNVEAWIARILPVPEPTSGGLLGVGLTLFALARRQAGSQNRGRSPITQPRNLAKSVTVE